MIYTTLIKKAISFSTQVHETDQKQKRKGKDIPYIVHPLNVGLILSLAGTNENTIVAGILHDTLEDSIAEKKITKEILAKEFNEEIADLVDSVTEQNKELSWDDRKKEALEHIKKFSHGSLLLKSADILNNASELLEDYEKNGNAIFERFNAPKEKILKNYFETINAIIKSWPDNPLVDDLQYLVECLQMMEKQNVALFVGFIINEKDCSYEVHLVNPTDKHYSRVFALTGAYCGDDDGLIETSKATKEKGTLSAHSSLLLERGDDLDEFDFVIWFHLDIYEAGKSIPTKVWFQLPKYGWNSTTVHLPVLEKKGTLIELEDRNDRETIEEEITHLNMNGGYHKSAGE